MLPGRIVTNEFATAALHHRSSLGWRYHFFNSASVTISVFSRSMTSIFS
ncbi:MAG: hypothetical protein ACI83P_002693, partial [Janthinobacterium sp.]